MAETRSAEADASWHDTTAYERWFDSSLGRAYGSSVNAVIRPWIAAAGAALAIDVGCGPGITAGSVVAASTRLVEVDCSFLMARRALARLAADGHHVRSVVGSCAELPLVGALADLVLCINCLEFVRDRGRSFAELRRVLRPGGTAVVGVLNVRSPWELTRRLKAPFVSKERGYYRRGRFFTTEELRGELSAASLELVDLAFAVHFPPVLSRFAGFYRLCEHAARRWTPARGAVILARAVAR